MAVVKLVKLCFNMLNACKENYYLFNILIGLCGRAGRRVRVSVCVWVRACVRVCVCVRACVRACVYLNPEPLRNAKPDLKTTVIDKAHKRQGQENGCSLS